MRQALRLTFTILIGMALAVPALAAPQAAPTAPPPPPCTDPEYRQLDFWVGEWDLTWPGGGTGTNRIEKILDGCVIQESFVGNGPPQPLTGRSVSTYSVREKKWKQTWVDSQGAYLDLTGELKDGEMRLSRHSVGPDGKPRMGRMVFFNIKPDSFDWRWEASTDDGKTWQIQWPIHYKRKGTP